MLRLLGQVIMATGRADMVAAVEQRLRPLEDLELATPGDSVPAHTK